VACSCIWGLLWFFNTVVKIEKNHNKKATLESVYLLEVKLKSASPFPCKNTSSSVKLHSIPHLYESRNISSLVWMKKSQFTSTIFFPSHVCLEREMYVRVGACGCVWVRVCACVCVCLVACMCVCVRVTIGWKEVKQNTAKELRPNFQAITFF